MPQAQTVSPIINLVPLILIFAVFYFLLIRPQKKQEKEHKNMLSVLKKNDEVVTSSGIHGTIVNIKDKTVTLRIDDNVKIEIEKNCIAYTQNTQNTNQGA